MRHHQTVSATVAAGGVMFAVATAALAWPFSSSPAPAPASKGIRTQVVYTNAQGVASGSYSGSYALLVGVSKYMRGWPSLDAVPRELEEVELALRENGFEVRKVIDPDSEGLARAYEKFIKDYGYDRDNRLLFFFSGHGYTLDKGERGYLVPTDAPDPARDEKGFRQKALDMTDILGWCRKMTAKHAIFLFDSCFSGTIFTTRGRPEAPSHITALTDKPVRQFIAAGSAGQEVPAKSIFTPCFVKALRGEADFDGDGFVVGTEMGMYLFNKVTDYSERMQTPQFGKIKDPRLDEGDFVFLTTRVAPQVAAPAPAMVEPVRTETAGPPPVPRKTEPVATPPPVPAKVTGPKAAKEGETRMVDLGGGVKMEVVWIPAGEFTMGSPDSEAGRESDEKQHKVSLTKGFWLGKKEVTQEQWQQVMGTNPSRQKAPGNPVEQVSWNDAKAFIGKLNEKIPGWSFRLPTEAEWEYACRAGTATPFSSGSLEAQLDKVAWYGGNAPRAPQPVGGKAANAFGLHDMHGNVWEWCEDFYEEYRPDAVTNPKGKASGTSHVLRGGSYMSRAGYCRSADRYWYGSDFKYQDVGFRVAADR